MTLAVSLATGKVLGQIVTPDPDQPAGTAKMLCGRGLGTLYVNVKLDCVRLESVR